MKLSKLKKDLRPDKVKDIRDLVKNHHNLQKKITEFPHFLKDKTQVISLIQKQTKINLNPKFCVQKTLKDSRQLLNQLQANLGEWIS